MFRPSTSLIVHRDRSDIAETARTRLPLAETSIFSGALEPWKSITSLPTASVGRVAAVARIPDKPCRCHRPPEHHVTAAIAVDRVIARCRR